jgi:S-adenosylmethionine:tRNA ribosyltransferase-isomerase
VGKEEDHFIISFSWAPSFPFSLVLENAGAIPLPPYIKRSVSPTDQDRYQTVFARSNGSVAAPTAALHFTSEVFQNLQDKKINTEFVTLHVGAGTFKPMKGHTAAEHQMHSEPFSVTLDTLKALVKTKDIVAVGTTSLRTLESLYWIGIKMKMGDVSFSLGQWEAYEINADISYFQSIEVLIDYLHTNKKTELLCRTSLMIVPGYIFRSAKALITNFHQPKSTLLLLIAAFVGDDWKMIYQHALHNEYRFLSYGDSSLLWRKD